MEMPVSEEEPIMREHGLLLLRAFITLTEKLINLGFLESPSPLRVRVII
jgi:hypothetical protein